MATKVNTSILVQDPPSDTITGKTMEAAVFSGSGRIEVKKVPLPVPGPKQIRVAVEGCGISNLDISAWEGKSLNQYPLPAGAPGHEGWGTVDEVGEKVTGYAKGEKVAFYSSHAFAEYDLVDVGCMIKLPPSFRTLAFPGVPLGQVYNIFKICDIRKGQTVAVVGAGFMGSILVRLLHKIGAKVIAISQRPYSLYLANECGASFTVNMEDMNQVIQQVKEITSGQMCDRVIEITGKEFPLNIAAEIVAEKGKMIIAGLHQDGFRNVNMFLWNIKGFEVINAYNNNPASIMEGMREMLKLIIDKEINLTELYSHSFSIAEIEKAFRMAKERPEGFIKGIISF
ncbi:MAG: MDR/zinc-dependent alcohol dehydrogenase-like family protein [Cytophagaceae bacterium]